MPRRKLTTLMSSATFVATLAACGSATNGSATAEPPDGFMTLAETQTEYDQTVADFPYQLPDGVAFPKTVQQPTEATIFQDGSGLVQAYQFWECSWMDQYLRAGSDQGAADAALAELEGGTHSVYRTKYVVDGEQNWTSVALARAALGDGSVLKDFFDSDCIWYRSETAQ